MEQKLLLGWRWILRVLDIPVGDNKATGECQRGDRVLVHKSRQGCKHRLIGTSLEPHSTSCRLNQEVTYELISGSTLGDMWWWIGHFQDKTKGIGKGLRIPHNKGAWGSVPQQIGCLLAWDVRLVPIFGWIANESAEGRKLKMLNVIKYFCFILVSD